MVIAMSTFSAYRNAFVGLIETEKSTIEVSEWWSGDGVHIRHTSDGKTVDVSMSQEDLTNLCILLQSSNMVSLSEVVQNALCLDYEMIKRETSIKEIRENNKEDK